MEITGKNLHADCVALERDFEGCPEASVTRIKLGLLERVCAPDHRAVTRVLLHKPIMMGESAWLTARFERGENKVVLRSVIDNGGGFHVFPVSEYDQ
mgnify:CR=1 FL=1